MAISELSGELFTDLIKGRARLWGAQLLLRVLLGLDVLTTSAATSIEDIVHAEGTSHATHD